MVAYYDETRWAAMEPTIRRTMHKQGVLSIVLGALLALIWVGPLVALMAIDGRPDMRLSLLAIVILVLLAVLVVAGVRQICRRLRRPEFAMAITSTSVLFPEIERPSAFLPPIGAEEWEREGTHAELIPASGRLQPARVEFTWQDGHKRRRRSAAADSIDVEPRVIVEALADSPTC
ncbi:hypothetical protein BJ979_002078 [Schumannella luteola]|uniref:Uncharacterized protein n=1 Tax=Schumannella luteola TaxID=472059 RepID=A0A852YC85_9MICO|nr:hypothetical protein [Schumannella luteola]NYG99452.1 hypothetical protein [Schumannella luteola]